MVGAAIFVDQWTTQQRQRVGLATEAQISTRYASAVDQISSSDLQIRLGGIYAIESLISDHPSSSLSAIQLLASFVRINAPDPNPAGASTPPGSDVQAALSVIGRSGSRYRIDSGSRYRIDLSGTHLSGSNLAGLNLSGVILRSSDLSSTNLGFANLSGADLQDVKLVGTNLIGVDLHGANLAGVNYDNAMLDRADLSNAFGLDVDRLSCASSMTGIILPSGVDVPTPRSPKCP